MASSSSIGGPSPLGSSHQDSDTDEIDDLDADVSLIHFSNSYLQMDDEHDDEDTTLTHQALQDVVKPEPQVF